MGQYQMKKNTLPNSQKTVKVYPKMVNCGQLSTSELMDRIAEGSGISRADVCSVLSALSRRIALDIAFGNTVKVDGIGVFSASLALRPDRAEEQTDGHNRN